MKNMEDLLKYKNSSYFQGLYGYIFFELVRIDIF